LDEMRLRRGRYWGWQTEQLHEPFGITIITGNLSDYLTFLPGLKS
jgi:hypothetical protein